MKRYLKYAYLLIGPLVIVLVLMSGDKELAREMLEERYGEDEAEIAPEIIEPDQEAIQEAVVVDAPAVFDTDIERGTVIRAVDGDTLKVMLRGKEETVRVIGINTPETLDPRKPVECFGREASDFAKKLLAGAEVALAIDPTQDSVDKYRRFLRYVTLPDGRDYGEMMIRSGYAYEYTYKVPYEKQALYKSAQQEAEANEAGLWSPETCNGSKTF